MNDLVVIQQQIYEVNGERVMFDDDLAKLYGVETAQLKRAVNRCLILPPPCCEWWRKGCKRHSSNVIGGA